MMLYHSVVLLYGGPDRFIVVLELSDFHVIVLEVFEPCLRVFDNCSLKELSVKAFSVAEGFWELRTQLRLQKETQKT